MEQKGVHGLSGLMGHRRPEDICRKLVRICWRELDLTYWQSTPSGLFDRSLLVLKNSTSSVSPAIRVCCFVTSAVVAVSRVCIVKGIFLEGFTEGKLTGQVQSADTLDYSAGRLTKSWA